MSGRSPRAAHPRPRCSARPTPPLQARAYAFTLVELLVVVAILAVLMSLLLPALGLARMRARVVCVHSDLNQIGVALAGYSMCNRDKLPPVRMGCGEASELQLPEELAKEEWLPPPSATGWKHQSQFMDRFKPGQTYKYRAPGPVWYNGQYYDFPAQPLQPRAWLWVPDDFPQGSAETGYRYKGLDNEQPCPASYAIWSVGPDPAAAKFPRIGRTDRIDESKFPLGRKFWLRGANDAGLITHFVTQAGHTFMSP